MTRKLGYYRMSEGHFLKYNVRMCMGCNQVKPRDKRPASVDWRCADCRAAAKAAKKEDV